MQAIIVTKTAILTEAVTCAMLREMAVKLFAYSEEAVDKLMSQDLSKPSKLMAGLTCTKLRTVLMKKLDDSTDDEYGQLWRDGALEVEFDHLPDLDLDIGKAGANTKKAGGAKRSKLAGVYHIGKKPTSASVLGGDAGKWEIWEHIWNCTSFEEYFQKAPTKALTTKTNRLITPSMEMNWAVKCGWVIAGEKPAE
jgi:hypothetical protein